MSTKTVEKVEIPEGAKKPEDYRAKGEPEKKKELEVTVRGIKLTIDPESLDDFELMDDLNELEQNENPTRLPAILRRLVGDQYKDVLNQLRGENGRISIETGAEFLGEVMEAINPSS